MKIDWNSKYLTISAYAFLSVSAAALFIYGLFNFGQLKSGFLTFLSYTTPFIIGFCISYILNPMLSHFERKVLAGLKVKHKTRRILSLACTYVVAILFLTLILIIVIPQVSASVVTIATTLLPEYAKSADKIVNAVLEVIPTLDLPDQVVNSITQTIESLLKVSLDWVSVILPKVISMTRNFTSGVANFVIGIIASFYMLYGKERFFAQTKKIVYAFFPTKSADKLTSIVHQGHPYFKGYILGQFTDALIVGIICFIGCVLLGIEYPMLIAVIIAITNLIPYFGPFIGVVPTALVILMSNSTKLLPFLIFILILQQIDGNIILPRILGQSTGIHSFWVLFSILFFGGIFGIPGMFLGVPVFGLFYALFKAIVEERLAKRNMKTETRDYTNEKNKMFN